MDSFKALFDEVNISSVKKHVHKLYKDIYQNIDARTASIRKYVVEFIHEDNPIYVKLIKPKINNPNDEFYIKLYSCKQETPFESEKLNPLYEPLSIHYYGLQIMDYTDIQHDFCSIFGSEKLSYHGTKLETNLDNQFKNVINKIPKEITEVNAKKEMIAFKDLNTISKDYLNNYYNYLHFFEDYSLISTSL